MLTFFVSQLMGDEADALSGREWSGRRQANELLQREPEPGAATQAGTVDLALPRLRAGSYFPEWLLDRRSYAEQALIGVVATCYRLGLPTRRVERLAQSLGVTQLSKFQVSKMTQTLTPARRNLTIAVARLGVPDTVGESRVRQLSPVGVRRVSWAEFRLSRCRPAIQGHGKVVK
jgi:hypothetical protein